jgi:hypothetical protein
MAHVVGLLEAPQQEQVLHVLLHLASHLPRLCDFSSVSLTIEMIKQKDIEPKFFETVLKIICGQEGMSSYVIV